MAPVLESHITNPLTNYPQALERAAQIRYLVLDVDGVLTSGQVFFGPDGKELMKGFDIQDGFGIKLLQSIGVECAVITGRHSKMVLGRCDELGITHVFTGVQDKKSALLKLQQQLAFNAGIDLAVMGDDWPDLSIMESAGLRIAPAQAHEAVRQVAHYVTQAKGGFGAVREACDLILKAQGHYDSLLAKAKN
jgi:3-deoxy-D-manno-octulosonate 8-phosphate phosphatase (KDO 8-P phosphatase)